MTKTFVLFWQDIPTVIEARDAIGIEKVELSKRFSELVDLIAMKKGLSGTDDYLQNWKKRRFPNTEKVFKQILIKKLIRKKSKIFPKIFGFDICTWNYFIIYKIIEIFINF